MFVSLNVTLKKDISYFEFSLWLNLISINIIDFKRVGLTSSRLYLKLKVVLNINGNTGYNRTWPGSGYCVKQAHLVSRVYLFNKTNEKDKAWKWNSCGRVKKLIWNQGTCCNEIRAIHLLEMKYTSATNIPLTIAGGCAE